MATPAAPDQIGQINGNPLTATDIINGLITGQDALTQQLIKYFSINGAAEAAEVGFKSLGLASGAVFSAVEELQQGGSIGTALPNALIDSGLSYEGAWLGEWLGGLAGSTLGPVGSVGGAVIGGYLGHLLAMEVNAIFAAVQEGSGGQAAKQAFANGQSYTLPTGNLQDVPSIVVAPDGSISVPQFGVTFNPNGTVTTAQGTFSLGTGASLDDFSWTFNARNGSGAISLGEDFASQNDGTTTVRLNYSDSSGNAAATGTIGISSSAGGSSSPVSVYKSGATDIINYSNGSSEAVIFSPSAYPDVQEGISGYSGPNGTGAWQWNILNFRDGTSLQKIFNPGSDATEADFRYSGQNATGALQNETVDYTNGMSAEWLQNPQSGISESGSFYSGPNLSGSPLYTIANYTNGTSAQWVPYSSGDVTQAGFFFSGPTLSGAQTYEIVDYTNGQSAQWVQNPQSGISQAAWFYSGANLSGSQLYEITNYTDGSSAQWVQNPAGNITKAAWFYSGPTLSGSPLYEVVDYTNGTSQQWVPNPGSGITEAVYFYSGPDRLGTMQYEIANYSNGTSAQFIPNPGNGFTEQVFVFSGPLASGTVQEAISDLPNGTSQVYYPSTGQTVTYSGTNGTGSVIGSSGGTPSSSPPSSGVAPPPGIGGGAPANPSPPVYTPPPAIGWYEYGSFGGFDDFALKDSVGLTNVSGLKSDTSAGAGGTVAERSDGAQSTPDLAPKVTSEALNAGGSTSTQNMHFLPRANSSLTSRPNSVSAVSNGETHFAGVIGSAGDIHSLSSLHDLLSKLQTAAPQILVRGGAANQHLDGGVTDWVDHKQPAAGYQTSTVGHQIGGDGLALLHGP